MNSKQRRKWARKSNGGSPHPHVSEISEQLQDGYFWYASPKKMKKQKEPDQIPGIDCPPEIPAFTEMVKRNSWHDRSEVDKFVEVIKELSKPDKFDGPMFRSLDEPDPDEGKPMPWSWARNWNCKYVELRFDMRDGGFVLRDDKGHRICLEQLMWQWRSESEREKEKTQTDNPVL
jgi:hypothetical protein